MQFLECWTELSFLDLLRLLAPAGFLSAAALLPGAGVARLAALGVALTLPFLRELGGSAALTAAWCALWLLVALGMGMLKAWPDVRWRPVAAGSKQARWGSCWGSCSWHC